MVMLPDAWVPEGLRLYAIGDVHGCTELLAGIHARIEADLAERPAADWRVIHLGDYVDRGPDSAGVLRMLLEYRNSGRADFLLGNHDGFLIDFLADPSTAGFDVWMDNGGIETLDSFGVDGMAGAHAQGAEARRLLCEELTRAVPVDVANFLTGLMPMLRYGDYAFVHAGVKPGVPLESQALDDLLWIRRRFLASDEDHGAVIVHGHTPTETVDLRRNRIGIDTGAVFSGNLTCLVLEGMEQMILGEDGPEPLAGPS